MHVMNRTIVHGTKDKRYTLKKGEICPKELEKEMATKGFAHAFVEPLKPAEPTKPEPAKSLVPKESE